MDESGFESQITIPGIQCYTCGKIVVGGDLSDHKCDPVFLVWCPVAGYDEDDGEEIRARDSMEAAEQWARNNDDSRSIASGDQQPIICVKDESGSIKKYKLSGQIEISYWAQFIS